ncbi:radical SAM protein [Paenibacillus sp. FSL H8-0048]|uniref:radical SAM/SPASM domain-containing protein n=1 Tax=Paenibacillus sp. FSL H8-0048 TaxID=2954508 RepID=UPI0030F952D5
MSGYRVSKYNIYLEMKRDQNKKLMIQGIRGAFDIVDHSIAEILEKGEADSSVLDAISIEDKEVLANRGYITTLTDEEEYKVIERISHTLNASSRKNLCITIMPTYNCNFRCEYCFEQNLLAKGKEFLNKKISVETVDAIFVQLAKYKAEGYKIGSVYLFGGEPLLKSSKDIVTYICEKCREMNIPISCISNGYFLDEYVDLINEYKFQKVQITIDGIGEEHDKRRFLVGGQGTYDRIKANISLALEKGNNISLRTNVNRKNTDSVKALIEEYQKEGWIGKPNFHYYFKTNIRCYEQEDENALSDVELMQQLGEYVGQGTDRFNLNSIYSGLAEGIRYMLQNNSYAPLRSGFCGANTGMYTIDPFGDIYPCWDVLSEADSRIGTVDVQQGEFVLTDVHSTWKDRTVDRISDCSKCRYMLFCGGGCSAQAKVMHNDMNQVYCDDFTALFDEVAVDLCEEYSAVPS